MADTGQIWRDVGWNARQAEVDSLNLRIAELEADNFKLKILCEEWQMLAEAEHQKLCTLMANSMLTGNP